MILFSAIWFLLIAGIAVFPMFALRKHQRSMWWDYAYPFTGVIAWFGVSGVGSTVSLSNFVVEVFWIAVLSAVIPWARLFMSKSEQKKIKVLSHILTFLPIVATFIIRLTMPTLPE